MSITFVIGPACAGKSYFIKNNYKEAKVIDLYDFQRCGFSSVDDIWRSYVECAEALKKTIKEGNNEIVLEHTLLKRKRREWYISQIREITDEDIKVICILPSPSTLCKQSKERGYTIDEQEAKEIISILEIPVKEEGYSDVTIIHSDDKNNR